MDSRLGSVSIARLIRQHASQDRFGEGHFFHPKRLLGFIPWGVVHDVSWGLFGRIPAVQDRLGPKWGGEFTSICKDAFAGEVNFKDDILRLMMHVSLVQGRLPFLSEINGTEGALLDA